MRANYNFSTLPIQRKFIITHLRIFFIRCILLSVEEPIGDFVLSRVFHDGDQLLNLQKSRFLEENLGNTFQQLKFYFHCKLGTVLLSILPLKGPAGAQTPSLPPAVVHLTPVHFYFRPYHLPVPEPRHPDSVNPAVVHITPSLTPSNHPIPTP